MPSRKPAWNSTIHDLSVHRATRREIEQRRERYRSPNAEVAKAEVLRRREILASRGSFDDTMFQLARAGGKGDRDITNSALQELDQVCRAPILSLPPQHFKVDAATAAATWGCAFPHSSRTLAIR